MVESETETESEPVREAAVVAETVASEMAETESVPVLEKELPVEGRISTEDTEYAEARKVAEVHEFPSVVLFLL